MGGHSGQPGVVVFAPGLTAFGSGQVVDLTTLDTAHAFPGKPEFQFMLGGVTIGTGGIGYANGVYGAHGDVVLAGGLLATPDGLDLAGHALRGNGSLVGRLHLDALASLRAEGGLLAVGDANRSGMLELAGTIDAAAHSTLVLNQAEAAHLGTHTTLEDASRLVSVNGLVLDAGNVLDVQGAAEIQGRFANQGSVNAMLGSGAELTFLNDVNGAGSFAGRTVFHAGYSPGNSPATIDFGGGLAQYDASSVLTMEIAGPPESGAHDRLTNIGTLDFHGILKILFTGGYVPLPGATFDLFDFAHFTGGFERIAVEGFDATKLDFSRLAIDGKVSAVPLSAALWPFAIAGAAMARKRRRV